MFGVFKNIIFCFIYKEAVAQAQLCALGIAVAWSWGYQTLTHLFLEAQLRRELNLQERWVTVQLPGGHPPHQVKSVV